MLENPYGWTLFRGASRILTWGSFYDSYSAGIEPHVLVYTCGPLPPDIPIERVQIRRQRRSDIGASCAASVADIESGSLWRGKHALCEGARILRELHRTGAFRV